MYVSAKEVPDAIKQYTHSTRSSEMENKTSISSLSVSLLRLSRPQIGRNSNLSRRYLGWYNLPMPYFALLLLLLLLLIGALTTVLADFLSSRKMITIVWERMLKVLCPRFYQRDDACGGLYNEPLSGGSGLYVYKLRWKLGKATAHPEYS